MIILYCSKKPYSDIDLLVLSKNQCRSRSNGWLDITEINNGEFIEKLQRLDIAVTDPLFSGEVIYGNKDTCNRLKNIALNIPITQESIAYNTKMASIQLKNYEEETNPELGNIYKSYNRSYMFNAISLSQGVKLLTLKGIEGEYGRYKSKETSQ
jgi:ribosomal protein L30E